MRLSLIILTVAVGLLLVGCSSKKECEASSECIPKNACYTAKCTDFECVQTPKIGCCGNGICERDAGENECTCKDCGVCESKGKIKYNITTTRGPKQVESKYARFVCSLDSQCVVGVAKSDVNELSLSNPLDESGFFRSELLTNINQPFNIATDEVSLRIRLTDLTDRVSGGVTFTNLQVLSGNTLMGEKPIRITLSSAGEIFTESLSLTSPQSLVEEEKAITVKVDYEYSSIERDGTLLKRSSKKISISSVKILVVSQ